MNIIGTLLSTVSQVFGNSSPSSRDTLDRLNRRQPESDEEAIERRRDAEAIEAMLKRADLKQRQQTMVQKVAEEVIPPETQTSIIPLERKNWQARTREEISPEQALEKMYKNANLAITEHAEKEKRRQNKAFVETLSTSLEEILRPKDQSLNFSESKSAHIGTRDAQEDKYFVNLAHEAGVLLGVFDGHGGANVAEFVNERVQEKFFDYLKKYPDNLLQVFENLIQDIHKEITEHPEWSKMGCTSVISFIDKKTHAIYTATTGDSEANIYREINGEKKSIPLSCIRDWQHPKEMARCEKILQNSLKYEAWRNGRSRRVNGLIISRSLGDHGLTHLPNHPSPIITQKPKVSINLLQPDDILILCSDGLKHNMPFEGHIMQKITESEKTETPIAEALTEYVCAGYKSKIRELDNTTVIAIKVSQSIPH